MFIAGTKNSNGEENVRCDTLQEALTWLRDQLDEGYTAEELSLFEAKPIAFSVELSPTITARGLTI